MTVTVKTVTKSTETNWTKENVSDVVVKAYSEVVDVEVENLSPEMWEMSCPKSIDTIFKENKCDEVYLSFIIGDITIQIDTETITVTKQHENIVEAVDPD